MDKFSNQVRACAKSSNTSSALGARSALALAVALSAMPLSQQVVAQAGMLEEVIVTAQKREESNQEVPISITAFSADDISRRGIENTDDLIGQIPGVGGVISPGARGTTNVSIRGVSGGSASNLSLDPAVATYIDGVFIGKMAGGSVDVAELQRIEVLRGPQGTLYGRNATGGAINYITRKPSGEFGVRAIGNVGDYDLYGLKLNVDTPSVGDVDSGIGQVAANFGVQTRNRDGFYDINTGGDGYNNLDRQAWRVGLSLNFREKFFADYAYDGSQLDEINNLDAVVGFNPLDSAGNVDRVTALQGTLAQARGWAATPGTDPRIASRWIPSLERTIDVYERSLAEGEGRRGSGEVDFEPRSTVDVEGHALTLAWDIDSLTFKSITAYREVQVSAFGDIDDIDSSIDANGVGAFNDTAHLTLGQIYGATGGFDPGIPQVPLDAFWGAIDAIGGAPHFSQNSSSDYEQFSQELQVLGSTDRIEWVAGLYYFEDDAEYTRTSLALVPLAPVGTTFYDLTNEAWAVFGQATWTPGWLNDRIEITGGLRYTEEDKDILWDNDAQISVLAASVPAASATNDENFDNVSGNLTVAFQATDDLNAYVRYATGYRSGGFNGELFNSEPIEEETIETWELGLKSDWWDGRLRLNAALYTYTWDDLQVSQIEIVNGTPSTRIVNAGKAERWGGEIEMLLAPVDDLVLGVSYSHLDGDYEEFPDLCGTNVPQECLTGEDFAKRGASPDNQLNVFADYLIARTGFGELTTFVNLNWQDDWYETAAWTAVVDGNPVVYPHQVMDARTVIDARLSLENIELGGGNLRVSLWGKNLMDETYPNYSINFGSSVGLIVENYGDPRTWGVELAYEY